jgi:hypothetical protein
MTPETLTWVGIAACLSQSAMFSGLNLAMFGISRLNLEAAAEAGLDDADAILDLRKDANFLLSTILWGNVSVNCLLTLLSDSVLAGVSAFAFSTVGITLVGEIVPQAYFSRNALRIGARLAPVLRFYQFLLYPVAKPSALMLDWWLGGEGVTYYRESDLREVIKMHMHADESDLSRVEGMGALNFISLDDLRIADEGEPVDEASIITLPAGVELPLMPAFERVPTDPFIRQVNASGHKWVILTDLDGDPRLVLDADGFLRAALLDDGACNAYAHCHRPIIVRDPKTRLGRVIRRLRVDAEHPDDDVVHRDVILLWSEDRRVITGADLLGRLLRGITTRDDA